MVLNDDGPPTLPISLLSMQRALIETCPSPTWRLYRGWMPRKTNRQAGQIGNGTRRARALLKRLDAQEHAKNKSQLYSSHPAINKPCQKERIGTAAISRVRFLPFRQSPSFHTELAPL
jgi:hypothetical protein